MRSRELLKRVVLLLFTILALLPAIVIAAPGIPEVSGVYWCRTSFKLSYLDGTYSTTTYQYVCIVVNEQEGESISGTLGICTSLGALPIVEANFTGLVGEGYKPKLAISADSGDGYFRADAACRIDLTSSYAAYRIKGWVNGYWDQGSGAGPVGIFERLISGRWEVLP